MDYNEIFSGLGSSFKTVRNTAYGEVSGYPVMVIGLGGKKAFTVSITTAEAVRGQLLKEVSRKAKESKIRLNANRRMVSCKVSLKKGEGMEKVIESAKTVAGALRENGVNPPRNCGICSGSGADAYVQRVDGVVIYDAVHRECMNKIQTEANVIQEENPGSYGMGILGALIGAIVGIIPAFIGIYVMNIVSAWLFALIPIATYYGYKKMKGKMNNAAPIFAILFSLIGLGLLLLVLDVCVNLEYGAGIGDAIYTTIQNTFVMYSAEYWSWITPNIGKIILFFVLGLVFSISIVGKTNKSNVKVLNQTMETLRPMGGTGTDYYSDPADSFTE